jgi:hypothetical protein
VKHELTVAARGRNANWAAYEDNCSHAGRWPSRSSFTRRAATYVGWSDSDPTKRRKQG